MYPNRISCLKSYVLNVLKKKKLRNPTVLDSVYLQSVCLQSTAIFESEFYSSFTEFQIYNDATLSIQVAYKKKKKGFLSSFYFSFFFFVNHLKVYTHIIYTFCAQHIPVWRIRRKIYRLNSADFSFFPHEKFEYNETRSGLNHQLTRARRVFSAQSYHVIFVMIYICSSRRRRRGIST